MMNSYNWHLYNVLRRYPLSAGWKSSILTPQLTQILLRHFRLTQLKTKSQNEIVTFFEARNECFLAVMKVQRNKDGVRILLGNKTGGGAVMLGPIRLCCVGVWISSWLPSAQVNIHLPILILNTYWRKIQFALGFPGRNNCVSRGVSKWINNKRWCRNEVKIRKQDVQDVKEYCLCLRIFVSLQNEWRWNKSCNLIFVVPCIMLL